MEKIGILLVNLGTPDSPSVSDVRRYLREFLSDPFVIDLPAPARWLLLNLVILPFRPRRSAHAYQQIWLPEGSPLLVHGRALQRALAARLGDGYHVALGMRYGNPTLGSALDELTGAGVSGIVALPLFPQYSAAATGSAVAAVERAHARRAGAPPLEIRGAFYDHPRFIDALAAVAAPRLAAFEPDHVLFSYHGLPESQVRKANGSGQHCLSAAGCCDAIGDRNRHCYRAQCFETTRAAAARLSLSPDGFETAFQSRLGRTPWIQPYTDVALPALAGRGRKRLAVLCPAFVADCLETVEEIGLRARDQWRELGGEDFLLVPSLNAEPAWVDALADILP